MLQNAKKEKFSGLFSIVILWLFPEIIIMHDIISDAPILFVLLSRFNKKLF